MLIYALDAESTIAPALAAALGQGLARHEDRRFDDGEHKWRPLTDPRGADAYVVASLHGGPAYSPHDKLCRLLMFAATLRDHGAARVSAVLPYLAYARKDRRTKPFDPLNLRYVAQLVEAVGIAQVFVLEAHDAAALENALRIPVQHLQAHQLFDDVAAAAAGGGPLAVASPDPGGVKRAQLWRESLQARLARPVGFAMVDKRRSAGVMSSESLVAGAVDGQTVLLIDDLVASGSTLVGAATALRRAGAREVLAFAAHGLFTGEAARTLDDPAITRLVVSDSVPPFRLPAGSAVAGRLQVVAAAPLFAQALRESREAWRR
ncbi:MAG: ribose-phosphate pyrophosphokinase [Leptothrix sp. (in: Bacteria)]|nr:ribose-phosphate pyrophosphokinase [Leptothrix sp. (in: b-proteobacteria)]